MALVLYCLESRAASRLAQALALVGIGPLRTLSINSLVGAVLSAEASVFLVSK